MWSETEENSRERLTKKAENELGSGFSKLANQITDIILRNSIPRDKDGQTQNLSKKDKKEIRASIEQLIARKTTDLDPTSPESSQVKYLAKEFLRALLEENTFKSLQSEYYLDIVSIALELAKDPSLLNELVIQTGFGGSADDGPSIRLPAYAIPGLGILEKIQTIAQKLGINHMPTLRLFFAPHSAIAINGGEMPTDLVLQNTKESIAFLKSYVNRFHPDLVDNVIYEIENPWDQHDPITRTIIDYICLLLTEESGNSIEEVLKRLIKLGENHGGKQGADLSMVYAAIHPLLFQDTNDHPQANLFDNSAKASLSVSIGGRPEKLFNSLRSFVSRSINSQMLAESNPDTKNSLNDWLIELDSVRQLYNQGGPTHPSDNPLHKVMAITAVGASPVYYRNGEADPNPSKLDGNPLEIIDFFKLQAEEQLDGKERSLALKTLNNIRFDIELLATNSGGIEAYLNFLSQLNI